MNRKRDLWKWAAIGLAGVWALAALGAASPAQGEAFHRDWGGGPGLALAGILHGLDLTADQRHQIAAILRTHKNELIQARRAFSGAARTLMEGVTDQTAKPEALQAKVDALADAGKQMGHIWLTVRGEAIAVLSPEQKQKLAERQQRFLKRMEARGSERTQEQEQGMDRLIEGLSK